MFYLDILTNGLGKITSDSNLDVHFQFNYLYEFVNRLIQYRIDNDKYQPSKIKPSFVGLYKDFDNIVTLYDSILSGWWNVWSW